MTSEAEGRKLPPSEEDRRDRSSNYLWMHVGSRGLYIYIGACNNREENYSFGEK
jgi:hypothetical protein